MASFAPSFAEVLPMSTEVAPDVVISGPKQAELCQVRSTSGRHWPMLGKQWLRCAEMFPSSSRQNWSIPGGSPSDRAELGPKLAHLDFRANSARTRPEEGQTLPNVDPCWTDRLRAKSARNHKCPLDFVGETVLAPERFLSNLALCHLWGEVASTLGYSP